MAKPSGINQEKILEVAEAIISAKGVKDTSLKDIAKAVGISKGTLYYHYSTKESLIYDITGRHFDLVIQRLNRLAAKMTDKKDKEKLLAIMLEEVGEFHQIGRLHLYLLHEVMSGNDELLERYRERYKEWQMTTKILLGKMFGAEHPSNEIASAILLAFFEGGMIRGTVLKESVPYQEMAGCIMSLYGPVLLLPTNHDDAK